MEAEMTREGADPWAAAIAPSDRGAASPSAYVTPASVYAAGAVSQMPAVEQKEEMQMDSDKRNVNVMGAASPFAGSVQREEGLKLESSKQASLPANEQPTEKRCSQCSATKTPMWRNDIHGNKTLCNACGVRLQRQVNKAKQQAQATREPPTSLIAGKLPRARTSPAKLSRHDIMRSPSDDNLDNPSPQPLGATLNRGVLTGHEQRGELPASPPKRKQGDVAAAPVTPAQDKTGKRACNERHAAMLASARRPWSHVPVELMVRFSSGGRRLQNEPQALGRSQMEEKRNVMMVNTSGTLYRATDDDLVFVERLNLQLQQQSNGAAATHDPKLWTTPLAQHTFERLIDAFDSFGAKTRQVLTAKHVVMLCEKCAWTPQRAIGLLVFRHWITKIQPDWAALGGARLSPRLTAQTLPRSFSTTLQPANGFMADRGVLNSAFHPESGFGDLSALEDIGLPSQHPATSETSDDTQHLSVLESEARTLPASLAVADSANPLPLAMPQMPEGPGLALEGDDIFDLSWVPAVSDSPLSLDDPKVAPNTKMEEFNGTLDPLDPANLANIADPRPSRGPSREDVRLHDASPSLGEDLSDQTTDDTGGLKGMEDLDFVFMAASAGQAGAARSDGAQTPPLVHGRFGLRRVVSLADAPEMTLRATSPGTPTSGGAAFPSLNKPGLNFSSGTFRPSFC